MERGEGGADRDRCVGFAVIADRFARPSDRAPNRAALGLVVDARRAQATCVVDPDRGMIGRGRPAHEPVVPDDGRRDTVEVFERRRERGAPARVFIVAVVRVHDQIVERFERVGKAPPHDVLGSNRKHEPGCGDGAEGTREDRFEPHARSASAGASPVLASNARISVVHAAQ